MSIQKINKQFNIPKQIYWNIYQFLMFAPLFSSFLKSAAHILFKQTLFSFLILRVKRGVEFPPFHKYYASQTFGVLGEFFVKCLTLMFSLRVYLRIENEF